MSELIESIKQAVINGKHKDIETLVREAVEQSEDPNAIINVGLIPAMEVVGKKFGDGQIYVPEMLVSAITMQKGMVMLKPLLAGGAAVTRGTIMMATVKGDLHDIGKNLVIMMLEGSGFKVVDLGVDLSVEKLVQKVDEVKPDILGLSALLTTTMPEMQKVIATLDAKGLRQNLKVMVGGAPVDAKFAQEIGADGYGRDASEAVQLAKTFTGHN